MEPFPFFRRPYYYYDQSRYINQYNARNRANLRAQENERRAEQEKRGRQNQSYNTELISKPKQKQTCNIGQSQDTTRISTQALIEDDFSLEIFGIKLYFDDILIIALIFFLYNEGVRDNFLFISLILLLLS